MSGWAVMSPLRHSIVTPLGDVQSAIVHLPSCFDALMPSGAPMRLWPDRDSESDPHGCGAALRFAVVHGLDVVAVRIEDEGGVVPWMVGAFPGCAVVLSAVRQCGFVEAVDHGPALGLERQVMAPGQLPLRGFAVRRRDEQLVRPEVIVSGAADRQAEGLEDRG